MPFPTKKRVIFNKNPLQEVICQLKFPSILKIETELPAEFQEKIRQSFPHFTETTSVQFGIAHEMEQSVPPELVQELMKKSSFKNYQFLSEDKTWKVNLTRNFIALSTTKYDRWESFRKQLSFLFQHFQSIYQPSYISRIGLRYIDVINRKSLNIEDERWRNLLNPSLLGLLSDEDIGDEVDSLTTTIEIKLPKNESLVKVSASLVTLGDNDEICFMIDSDFINQNKTDIDDVESKLNHFNEQGSRLIQWAISRKLFDAMEPEKI